MNFLTNRKPEGLLPPTPEHTKINEIKTIFKLSFKSFEWILGVSNIYTMCICTYLKTCRLALCMYARNNFKHKYNEKYHIANQ